MRLIKFALLAPAVLPALAWGGQIDGTLFRDGQPVANEGIRILCGSEVSGESKTDSSGTYRIYVKPSGMCSLEVVGSGLRHRISSYQYPARYDFDLVRQPEGNYLLRRR